MTLTRLSQPPETTIPLRQQLGHFRTWEKRTHVAPITVRSFVGSLGNPFAGSNAKQTNKKLNYFVIPVFVSFHFSPTTNLK